MGTVHVLSSKAAHRHVPDNGKPIRRKPSPMCHAGGWRPISSAKANKDPAGARVDLSKWIGPIAPFVTIAVLLLNQSRMEGSLQEELKASEKSLDRLDARVEKVSQQFGDKLDSVSQQLGDKLDSVSQQVSALGREISYLQGQKSAKY